MASNFKISAHRNGDNLYLRLVGGFDGQTHAPQVHGKKCNANRTRERLVLVARRTKAMVTLVGRYPAKLASPVWNLCDDQQ